jgi:hypothetical protein
VATQGVPQAQQQSGFAGRLEPCASDAPVTRPVGGTMSTLAEAVLDDLADLSTLPGTPPAAADRSRRRPPLVYATPTALGQARRLMPGRLLERDVERAIVRGDVHASQQGGFVFLDELGVVARCMREPGRVRPRPRAWTIVHVAAHRGRSR